MKTWLKRRRSTKVREEESGAVLILVGLAIVVLMGMAAFAIDFGWLYWNGIKIQHGADAAALAGVIYEPGDQTTAYAEAISSASENGYVSTNAATSVTPVDFADDPTAVDNENQLAVTVTHRVPTFFMSVFGVDSVPITRRAVSEYALPLAMGSDLPYFGEDPALGRTPNFWANIHGYYTGRKMGDRFSSQCNNGGSQSGCERNPEGRETISQGLNNGIADLTGGYIYGIEVPVGATNLAVEVFDGPFYRGGNDFKLVGDNPQGGSQGPTTVFLLYAPDPTPLDTTDGNKLLCRVDYAPEDSFADFDGNGSIGNGDDQDGDGDLDWDDVEIGLSGGVSSLWDRMCGSAFTEGPGVYPLRVVVEDPGSDDDRGLNRFSMRAFTSGPAPRFYGLGDMSIYANFTSSKATFNLARVPEVHAGKDLVIELWDPDSGNNGVRIEMPDGTLPPCTWTATDGRSGSLAPCDISYSTSFDNNHMQIRIAIPNGYTCSTNCWWTIEVSYNKKANDTTTWSARIEGNPVRLVE
ncbi:MAG: Tad domain-containing protein [Actinomycetia bacterium]|nr:Tad domain-containing protein [Actinomycetes bacterium]